MDPKLTPQTVIAYLRTIPWVQLAPIVIALLQDVERYVPKAKFACDTMIAIISAFVTPVPTDPPLAGFAENTEFPKAQG